MIIKKYQGQTETEAIILAKEDLGKDAIVTNIKKVVPKGIFRIFRKPIVEITAAIDDMVYSSNELKNSTTGKNSAIEDKLNILQDLIEKQITEKKFDTKALANTLIGQQTNRLEETPIGYTDSLRDDSSYTKLIFDQLIANEVDKEYATMLFNEIQINKDLSLDKYLASVYQKIVLKLGQPKTIEVEKDKTKFIFFMGPTGVGKTTTIAKIASNLMLNDHAKITLLTLDTYRIAAVEQLRTYANILGIPLRVIYSTDEFNEIKGQLEEYDLVLIDTAGRSHKDKEQQRDLESFLHLIEEEKRETYLVLSSTTKYQDLVNIANSYSAITKFNLIFTKLDETSNIGSILNLKILTGAQLSYTTYGQNVPDDICKLDTQSTAKRLLGGND